MIGLGAGVAALVFAGYFVRTPLQWVDELELSGKGVTQVARGVSRTLPWTAVKDVKRFTRGSEQWILSTHPGHPPMTNRADGLNRDEVKQIRELIPALHAAAARPPGVPVHEG
ncbi:MAG TPA: hypothetical protein VHG93_28400 [Longimicrobium sp.]|nr:hypothetical protein [Longimicrobium sp.]